MNAPGPQANENFQCADVNSCARRVQNRQPGVRLRKASQKIEDWFSSNPNILQRMGLRARSKVRGGFRVSFDGYHLSKPLAKWQGEQTDSGE